MYYIEQLKSKDLSGLQAIAQELGISNAKSLSKEDLIYRILDEQAFRSSQSGAPAVVKEENRMNRRNHRRNRITQDAGSKVYTATGDKAMKLDKSEAKRTQPKAETEPVEEKPIIKEEKVQELVREIASPKLQEPVAPEAATSAAKESVEEKTEQSAPKKRGRKPKAKKNRTAYSRGCSLVQIRGDYCSRGSYSCCKRACRGKNRTVSTQKART